MRPAIFVTSLCALWAACALCALPALARTPDDPLYGEQWYLEKIGAPAAWDVATGRRDVVVAVLDSGIDFDHPELAGNIWRNFDEVADNGVDDDRNGYVDDTDGWDFVGDDNAPEPDAGTDAFTDEGVAHGTVIAGLIGAVGNNGVGVSGVAWKVRIMPVRILDNYGAGDSGNARRAIEYAVENGADVINLSFTGFQVDDLFERAVNAAYVAGIPVVAAVGNGDDGGIDLDETPVYPACFQGEKADWVIGVAATTAEDLKADFSNYGADCTEISAPGEDITGIMYENPDWNDFQYEYADGWSGTSVAAPLVAGSIALIKSAFPSLSPTDLITLLQLSVDPIRDPSVAVGALGSGRLNVGRVMELAPTFAAASASSAAPTTGVSPITGLAEEISTVLPGSFIRSPGFDTVYYVDADERRHPLWDEKTYFTWNDSWDDVDWVTDATLATLSIGAILPPKPGVVLVKIQSEETVYAVEAGAEPWDAVLREVPSENLAWELYGRDWADYVVDIEPTLFTHYQVGEPMTDRDTVDRSVLKTRESL